MTTRRDVLLGAAGAVLAGGVNTARAGEFSGKIRKSLKWSMAMKAAAGMPLAEAFKKLRDCGYEGVEPSVLAEHVKDAAEWVAASKESGLVIDGMVGGRIGALEKGLDLTKALGGDSLLVVVSYDEKESIVAQWNRSRDALKVAASYAEKLGVKILLENVWTTFLISAFDMARFVDEVGSPWVQVHFDIGNMMRWGVAEHWAEVLGKRSVKLDVKDYNLEVAMKEGMRKAFDVPIGEGSVNWAGVRAELKKINYSGWAAAEVKPGDWVYLKDVAARMDKVLDCGK